MAKRKRRPGGGRKPLGDNAKLEAPFSIRLTHKLRADIERDRKRNRRGLSKEVRHLLQTALDFSKEKKKVWNGEHHYGLGRAVARLAWAIEISTGLYTPNEAPGKTWRDDAFAAAALRSAIDILIRGLTTKTPQDQMEIPERVKQHAQFASTHLLADQAAFYMTPEGIGSIAAMSLLEQLKTYDFPPLDRPPNEKYADIYDEFPKIRQALGILPEDEPTMPRCGD